MAHSDDLIEWADFGHFTPFTRRQWQALNPAPVAYARFSNKRFYRRSAVMAWVEAHLVNATAVAV